MIAPIRAFTKSDYKTSFEQSPSYLDSLEKNQSPHDLMLKVFLATLYHRGTDSGMEKYIKRVKSSISLSHGADPEFVILKQMVKADSE